MKTLFLMSLFLMSINLFSQIGVNTESPDTFFQIKTLSGGNDVRIDESGNIGLRVSPTVKLDVQTGGISTAPIFGLILKDGYEQDEKVLTCDDNGIGYWKDKPILRKVTANLSSGITLNYSTTGFLNTGTTITVPPGQWMLHVVILLSDPSEFGDTTASESVWVRSTFADHGLLVPSLDIIGSSYISGLGWKDTYSLIQGFIIIVNTSISDKTYDYLVGETQNNGALSGSFYYVGGSWNENNIIGYQIDQN